MTGGRECGRTGETSYPLTSSSKPNWHVVSPSRFPWEQEALDFVYARFPVGENYLAWSNFEFIADDGTINEVDLLVATPTGIFLQGLRIKIIEIMTCTNL